MGTKLWRSISIVLAFLVLFTGFGLWGTVKSASSAPKEITGETWTPPLSVPGKIVPRFLKEFEEATGGAVKIKWMAGSPLGPPPELYTRLMQGLIDFGQFNIGYTPGVFPFTEMFELPIHFKSEEILTNAIIDNYKKGYADREYSNVKVAFYYAIGPYQLWTRTKIANLADLKGKKLRCPSPTFIEATKAVGAVPVSMPATEIFSAFQKGIIDGTWACGDMAASFKIAEIAKYVVMVNLGTTTQTWAFNKKTYQALPDSGKKYVEANFDKLSLHGARVFSEYNEKGLNFARKNKVETIVWSEQEMEKMNDMLSPIFKKWVDQMEAKGLPGKKALTELYQNLEKQGMKKPFVLPK